MRSTRKTGLPVEVPRWVGWLILVSVSISALRGGLEVVAALASWIGFAA